MNPAEKSIQITLDHPLEIGRGRALFGSIASVCEDDQANIYVLDRIEFKVFKFASDGRLVTQFGQKGQGPGDFQSPNQIVWTSSRELAILEDLYYVSFLKTDGTFSRRLDLNGRLGLGYIGPDRFYGWVWRPEDKQQVVVDGRNNIIATFNSEPRDRFSVSVPDETGRAVMFNYGPDVYVPSLLFTHYGSLSAVGISGSYDIALLDESGRLATSIQRKVKPEKITETEKNYFEQDIREIARTKGWPGRVVRELTKKIPENKNLISALRLAQNHLFVFRFPEDITKKDSPIPIDLFSTQGRFLGTAALPEIPVFISGEAMYFARSDDSGNMYLVRLGYHLPAS
jgi:hypothetical protein